MRDGMCWDALKDKRCLHMGGNGGLYIRVRNGLAQVQRSAWAKIFWKQNHGLDCADLILR
jgi:hypothetical protein